MKVQEYSFGKIMVNGKSYETDLVIDQGEIKKRKKNASKHLKPNYGHTPLTVNENIPWNCSTLVIGTGKTGSLPITDEVYQEAENRGVQVIAKPTEDAIHLLGKDNTNFILHLTC
ncbi:MAG: MTH938/NDUFAF3 family protein [Spirochaetia bacterium]